MFRAALLGGNSTWAEALAPWGQGFELVSYSRGTHGSEPLHKHIASTSSCEAVMARLPHSPDEAMEVRPSSHIPAPDAWIQYRKE